MALLLVSQQGLWYINPIVWVVICKLPREDGVSNKSVAGPSPSWVCNSETHSRYIYLIFQAKVLNANT